MLWNKIPKVCFYFVFHGMEFRIVFSSMEWFRTEFPEFAFIFGILSIFLFRGMVVWNEITRDNCSVEQPEFHQSKPFVSRFCLPRNYFPVVISNPNCTIPSFQPSHPIPQLIPVVVEQRRFYTILIFTVAGEHLRLHYAFWSQYWLIREQNIRNKF